MEQLSLNTNSTQPGTILVTWRHNQDLDDVMCKAMGLFYDVIVTSNYDCNTTAMVRGGGGGGGGGVFFFRFLKNVFNVEKWHYER